MLSIVNNTSVVQPNAVSTQPDCLAKNMQQTDTDDQTSPLATPLAHVDTTLPESTNTMDMDASSTTSSTNLQMACYQCGGAYSHSTCPNVQFVVLEEPDFSSLRATCSNPTYIASLKDRIRMLKEDLSYGQWISYNYLPGDCYFMPAWVALANLKNPGLELSLGGSVLETVESIVQAVQRNNGCAKFLTEVKVEEGSHFALVEYRLIDNIPSIILFEPTQFTGKAQKELLSSFKNSIKGQLPNACCSFMEMNIKMGQDCLMFGLLLAKQIYRTEESIKIIHQLNINEQIPMNLEGFTPYNESDRLLSPVLFKHIQGQRRLQEYMQHSGDTSCVINKKGHTLKEYQDRYLQTINEKKVVNTIYQKRIRESEALLDIIN